MKYKVNNRLSVAHVSNKAFLADMQRKGFIGVTNAAPAITAGNINASLGALNYIRPGAVEILVAPQVAERMGSLERNGVWGDKSVTVKIKEFKGTTSPDDGMDSDGLQAKTNYENALRGVYYYMSSWLATDLEEATVGAMQEDYRADQAKAALGALAIDRNKFFFTGVAAAGSTLPVYGLLNDPSLPNYVPVVQGEGGSTSWADKTVEEIYNDIVGAMSIVNTQSSGLSDEGVSNGRGHWVLGVATDSVVQLKRGNDFGKTAFVMLQEQFGDRLEIVGVSQFNNADSSSDVFYLIYVQDNAPTVINSYVELAKAYPIYQKDSVTSQKISAATSGAIVTYPMFIARVNGIS